MERKRIEKLVVLLLIGILIPVSLFPFRINADTFSYVRVNGELMSTTYVKTYQINNQNIEEYLFNYQYKVKFDDSYLGYVQLSITQEFYEDVDNNGSVSSNSQKTYSSPTKTYYVNSDEVTVNLSLRVRLYSGHIQTNYDPCKYFTPSVQYSNVNVTKIGLLTSIDEVIDILSDIYSSVDDIEGLSTNQLTELENIVSNTSLANQYLDSISQLRNYNIYIESYNFNFWLLNRLDNDRYKVLDYYNYYSLNYPLYFIKQGNYIYRSYTASNQKLYFIIGVNKYINRNSVLSDYFTFNGVSSDFEMLNRTDINPQFSIIKFAISKDSNGTLSLSANEDINLIAFYAGFDNGRFSTDFALRFGLSNQLLDDLHIIANGTTQSSSASGSLDQTTSQFSDDANDLVTIEETFNDSMNQSLQNVNPTFNMGSSFLASANWVSQQFNRIVNNTPFASLITFGLTLGLGLLIIGKVRK